MDILNRRYQQLLRETKTDIHRFLYREIDWSQPLIGIKGQRGVGKTTMMLQRIKESDPDGTRSFYVSLDNMWFANNSLIDLVEKLVKQNIRFLYIDEVHKLKGWERYLKNIHDSYPELYVVFTGSSLLEIDHSVADLSRRVSMHFLPGLSFREFLMFEGHSAFPRLSISDILYSHETIAASLSSNFDFMTPFKKYMALGYYPFYRQMTRNDFYGRLGQIVSTVIESDIPALENKINYETLVKAKRLVGIIAGSLPYIPNITTLAGLMATNRTQIIKLFDLLERSGLIRQLYTNVNSPNSLAKPQKILLDNSSLMYALQNPQIGAVRECTFASLVGVNHCVGFAKDGDFMVDGRYLFEIGGKSKGFSQIRNIPDSFVVADDIEFGLGNKIPLYLFGFLY